MSMLERIHQHLILGSRARIFLLLVLAFLAVAVVLLDEIGSGVFGALCGALLARCCPTSPSFGKLAMAKLSR